MNTRLRILHIATPISIVAFVALASTANATPIQPHHPLRASMAGVYSSPYNSAYAADYYVAPAARTYQPWTAQAPVYSAYGPRAAYATHGFAERHFRREQRGRH